MTRVHTYDMTISHFSFYIKRVIAMSRLKTVWKRTNSDKAWLMAGRALRAKLAISMYIHTIYNLDSTKGS
jgi:hypothetical protein